LLIISETGRTPPSKQRADATAKQIHLSALGDILQHQRVCIV